MEILWIWRSMMLIYGFSLIKMARIERDRKKVKEREKEKMRLRMIKESLCGIKGIIFTNSHIFYYHCINQARENYCLKLSSVTIK